MYMEYEIKSDTLSKQLFMISNLSSNINDLISNLSCNVRKHAFWHVRQAKIPIRLRISRSLISIFTERILDLKCFHADNGDFDKTAQMRRLIWIFIGCTCQKVRLHVPAYMFI